MLWIGLTGGIASGKSTVAEMFKSLGIPVLGADGLAHDAMAAGSDGARAIRHVFGDDVFAADGAVDRAKLGAKVFADGSGELKLKLENILHPEVRKKSESERARFESDGHALAIYEIPLLFEKNLEAHFDVIVTVAISNALQIERLMSRSKLSESDARARVSAQLDQDRKVHGADFVIWNDGSLADLKRQVEKLVRDLGRSSGRSS